MNVDTSENTTIDDDFDTSIADFEIDHSSTNKKAMRKIAKHKYQVKEKLDFLIEKKFLEKQLNSLSDYWDM
jgi:hypothetical protein